MTSPLAWPIDTNVVSQNDAASALPPLPPGRYSTASVGSTPAGAGAASPTGSGTFLMTCSRTESTGGP